jgi:hypothetical protein
VGFGFFMVLANSTAFGLCGGILFLAFVAIDAVSINLYQDEIRTGLEENAIGLRSFRIDSYPGHGFFASI